jgi:hypothetical protein
MGSLPLGLYLPLFTCQALCTDPTIPSKVLRKRNYCKGNGFYTGFLVENRGQEFQKQHLSLRQTLDFSQLFMLLILSIFFLNNILASLNRQSPCLAQ